VEAEPTPTPTLQGDAALPGGSSPPASAAPSPVLPTYGGPCLTGLVGALLDHGRDEPPTWLPEPARAVTQVVLLVLDGLGWEQLLDRPHLAPTMRELDGGPITSVVPTTTATALTSITTGLVPADHGVVGYRVHVGEGEVMNVLRWRTEAGDARTKVRPTVFQPSPAFAGRRVPVVTRAEFVSTGFTAAHLAGSPIRGWRMPSTLPVEVARLLAEGERLVYAYYDGIDKVAHEWGLHAHYEAEVAAADHLVAEVLAVLPAGAALLVTSDHGQVDVGDDTITLSPEIMADVAFLSGEGRFRWLHARPGTVDRLAERATAEYGHVAWVRTRQQVLAEGWLGGMPVPEVEQRLGDVAVVAHAPVAFLDPADTGEVSLVSRHGSLTSAEMLVPLLARRV
jgi:hypothetical protein